MSPDRLWHSSRPADKAEQDPESRWSSNPHLATVSCQFHFSSMVLARELIASKPIIRSFSTTVPKMTWHAIPIPISELCIDTTLRSGQSFRWRQIRPHEYSCAIHGRLITLKQDATTLWYNAVLPPAINNETVHRVEEPTTPRTDSDQEEAEIRETRAFLFHYLNLKPDLGKLYESWSLKDKNFAKKAPKFHGVRVLKQDAWEALVGFICSSCNNIKRISQMMNKLCADYGPLIGYIDDVPFYDMPSPSALVNPRVEAELRDLGFGYRARYLFHTAQMVTREAEGWLDSLRNPASPVFGKVEAPEGKMQAEGREGYKEAHAALQKLQGVGAKVADCVCLFGLGWGEAVPVDTHVWQIAQRDYGFGRGKHKSLTKATYDAVGNHFRQLWGTEAGWAHSVLFTADLRDFAEKLADEVVKTEVVKTEYIKTEYVKTEDVKTGDVKTEDSVKVESIEYTPAKNTQPIATLPMTPLGGPKLRKIKSESSADSSSYDSNNVTPRQPIKVEVKKESIAMVQNKTRKRKISTVTENKEIVVIAQVGISPTKRTRSGRARG